MNELRKFYPWLIAAVVALTVLLGAYGPSRVSAGNPEISSDAQVGEVPLLERQEIFIVKQDTSRLPADRVSPTTRRVTPFAVELPDPSAAAARIVLLSTIITLWLSTRYFTRLLS